MNQIYEEVVRKAKIRTIDSVRDSQRELIPFMNKCRLLNCYSYRYNGRTYSYRYSAYEPEKDYGIISVEDMPYSSKFDYRSDQSFVSRLDTLIMNNKVTPILLFINGRFVKWEDIDVVFDCGNTWLKVYGTKYTYGKIKDIQMMIIPFQVFYISTEESYLFNKYFEATCKFINESARVRMVAGAKRLVIKIPRINDVYVTKDNESLQIGMWYYNQLKVYFSGLLSDDRIEKLKRISVIKTNYNEDGTIDRTYNTTVNLLDDDSIVRAQLESVKNINANTIANNSIFRFNDDGILDYDGETVITLSNPNILFRRKTYTLKPNQESEIDYSNNDIPNILFRENYIVFRDGMICNGENNIHISPYGNEPHNSLNLCFNGYKACNKFGTVEDGDNVYNNEYTVDGKLVEPTYKDYTVTVLTFYSTLLSQINQLMYKIPNRNLITDSILKDYYNNLENGEPTENNKHKYLQWLLKSLSFKYSSNEILEDQLDKAFKKIINHDLSLFNELYKSKNNYYSSSLDGKFVNENLITKGFFTRDDWAYTLNIPRIQVTTHQSYAMVFVNGILIDNYHLARILPNKICIPMVAITEDNRDSLDDIKPFNDDDSIEIFYFDNCNNNELIFHITKDETSGNIDRSINLNGLYPDRLNVFTGEYKLDETSLVYKDMDYDEKEVSFALKPILNKRSYTLEDFYTENGFTEDTIPCDFNHCLQSDEYGPFYIEGQINDDSDELKVYVKFIDNGYRKVVPLKEIFPNKNIPKAFTWEVSLDIPNEEFFYGKDLIMASDNKFIYQRFSFDSKCYKIRLDSRFRYCKNQDQFMIFVNGRKLNAYDFLISIPKLSRPFNAMYLYTSRFINPGDRLEVFYTPIKCKDLAFNIDDDKYMKIGSDGYLKLSPDITNQQFMKDAYWISINGKKVNPKDIIEMDSTLFKIGKDYETLKNLSIIPLLEDNTYEELDSYYHGDEKCDWDKAIDYLYNNVIDWENPTINLNELFNNTVELTESEEEDNNIIGVSVGRIAIINEIIRDFWVTNGYSYNPNIFLYDYYVNDTYDVVEYDEKTGAASLKEMKEFEFDDKSQSYILLSMDGDPKINIAKYDLYHLFFTYNSYNGFREIGDDEGINPIVFTWDYNNFYDSLSLKYQRLFIDKTESKKMIDYVTNGGKRGYIDIPLDKRTLSIRDTNDTGLDKIINSVNPSERYFKFRLKSSDGYSNYTSYTEVEFVNGVYYGLIDEDLFDKRESDIYTDNPLKVQQLMQSSTDTTPFRKYLNRDAELLLPYYEMTNFTYFVFAIPKNYAYELDTDGNIVKQKVHFYLPDINTDEFKNNNRYEGYIDSDRFTDNGEAISCTNAPILTDGTYRDNKTDDGDGYHGNLTSLNEYKLEKFMEFKYTNIYGYAEDYVVFKANGFFTKLKDNTRVRISIKVDD